MFVTTVIKKTYLWSSFPNVEMLESFSLFLWLLYYFKLDVHPVLISICQDVYLLRYQIYSKYQGILQLIVTF